MNRFSGIVSAFPERVWRRMGNNNNEKLHTKSKLINRIAVFKANNPSAFVFVMIVIINILSVIISSALLLFLPENRDRNFGEMMRFAFMLMVNPSGRYQYSDYPASLIVTTVVVLIGMISLTGGTVGYITSVINSIIKKTAQSRSKLHLENHIVILNYNHKVPSLVCDYAFDDNKNTYIVILSDKKKEEVEKSIANGFSTDNIVAQNSLCVNVQLQRRRCSFRATRLFNFSGSGCST